MEYLKAISPHRLLVYEDGQNKAKRANHSQNDSYDYPLYCINLLKNPTVEVVKKSLTRIECKKEPFGPSPSLKN